MLHNKTIADAELQHKINANSIGFSNGALSNDTGPLRADAMGHFLQQMHERVGSNS